LGGIKRQILKQAPTQSQNKKISDAKVHQLQLFGVYFLSPLGLKEGIEARESCAVFSMLGRLPTYRDVTPS